MRHPCSCVMCAVNNDRICNPDIAGHHDGQLAFDNHLVVIGTTYNDIAVHINLAAVLTGLACKNLMNISVCNRNRNTILVIWFVMVSVNIVFRKGNRVASGIYFIIVVSGRTSSDCAVVCDANCADLTHRVHKELKLNCTVRI